jgi:hypothetical protein
MDGAIAAASFKVGALATASFKVGALAAAAFGSRRHREQAGEDAALEQAIEDRAQNRLVEWTEVEHEREHGKDRE